MTTIDTAAMQAAMEKMWRSSSGPTQIYYGREWAIAMRDSGHDPEGRFLAAYDAACPDGGLCTHPLDNP